MCSDDDPTVGGDNQGGGDGNAPPMSKRKAASEKHSTRKRVQPTRVPPNPDAPAKSPITQGLERTQQMLDKALKGELGPVEACLANPQFQDPLHRFTREQMDRVASAREKRNEFAWEQKLESNPDPLDYALTPEEEGVWKAYKNQPGLTPEELLAQEKLATALESGLASWDSKLDDELKEFELAEGIAKSDRDDMRKMMGLAWSEFGEEVRFAPPKKGDEDDTVKIDLDLFKEESDSEEEETLPEQLPALTIDFLDVGMGDSALFVCGDGTTVLIDCGSTSSSKVPGQDALIFLKQRLAELQKLRGLGKPRIDRIYLTHPDQDHYNLLPSLFDCVPTLEVGQFHIGGEQAKYKECRDIFEVGTGKLLTMPKIFQKAEVEKYSTGFKGEAAPSLKSKATATGGAVSFRTLGANAAPLHKETKTNAASLVVLVEMARPSPQDPPVKILMMGDGEWTVEDQLLKNHEEAIRDSTLLHVGHHGAQIAATEPFLKVVNPRVAQISADQNWAHPYRTTVERITKNPALRVNEAMENDPRHSIVVGEGSIQRRNRVHTQEETTSAIIMNIGQQDKDTSDSYDARTAENKGYTPMEAIGQQWRVTFQADSSFGLSSTLAIKDFNFEFL